MCLLHLLRTYSYLRWFYDCAPDRLDHRSHALNQPTANRQTWGEFQKHMSLKGAIVRNSLGNTAFEESTKFLHRLPSRFQDDVRNKKSLEQMLCEEDASLS
ncbi:hypothetical protein Tsp_10286 [Trichinella spiralis]|uniref:hypothetical protein n=1 Tax=Trichinella spiralis TaxID=6334 RepID=UPI0001EFE1BE|nr:hypothetical protein Tsp_10286 [Trichinella spiralis]